MAEHKVVFWKRFYLVVQILFSLSCVYVYIIQTINGHPRAILGPVALLFLLLPFLARKVLGIYFGYRLRSMVLIFVFLAFSLGTALLWYDRYPHYDKFTHMLSGILFTLIGLCLFYRMQETPGELNTEWQLRLTFAICFSMAISVVWEIYEFTGYNLTGLDMQHHLDTGVFDTMGDVIANVIGSVIMGILYMLFVRKGWRSFLIQCMYEFLELNPKKMKGK